jgi:hypothetical protein
MLNKNDGKPYTHRPLLVTMIVGVASLTSACVDHVRGDLSSPFNPVPVGSVVQVERDINIPPGRTRVFVQRGSVSTGFNSYAPSCSFEVTDLDYDNTQVIEPGAFRVRRVERFGFEQVVQREPIQVASLGWHGLLLAEVEGSPMVFEGYHLWLESEAQPDVMRVTCRGEFEDVSMAKPPSIEEIRWALGKTATLTLPGDT